MGLKIIRWASLEPTPWKNGGGTAVDIAGSPEPMTSEGFDWRINIATIARSGPFSNFPGIDRDFRLLDGGDLELTVTGDTPRLLTATGPEYRFPGDQPTFARLLRDGHPCRAFNVLTRRGVFASRVEVIEVKRTNVLESESGAVVGVIRSGTLDVELGDTRHRLGSLDAFVATEQIAVHSTAGAELFLVRFTRV